MRKNDKMYLEVLFMNELFFENPKNRLEELMKENNYTLRKVSENTGIPITTLSGYKKNLRTPKKENAMKLAEFFGVSIPYFLGVDDNPLLKDPGSPKEMLKGIYKLLTKGTSIDNKITQWTPYGNDLAIILSSINRSEQLADYVDFMADKQSFNPILIKAIKQFISDKDYGLIPFLLNKSSDPNSPYHYVWEAWIDSDEYKKAIKKK